jgi:hypothetical protein
MVWAAVIVVALALVVGAVGLWLLLRDASPQSPGEHRGPGRGARRDPHDPVIRDDEPPPEEDK